MLLLASLSLAASLDNLEIGGLYGSPTATDGAAGWWNPAGFAAESGTRLNFELAYEDAAITFDRADPNGGSDIYTLSGTPIFLGVATDFGVEKLGPGRLGAGLSFSLPYLRGGTEVDQPGAGHFHMRDGDSKVMFLSAGVAYDILDVVSIGGTASLVHSRWYAIVDNDSLPDLRKAIIAQGGEQFMNEYTDEDLEDEAYTATLHLEDPDQVLLGASHGDLTATTYSFSAGVLVHPADNFAVGVTYIHGGTVENTGKAEIDFNCPPDSDTLGRAVASGKGLCNTTVTANATVAYDLPSRVQAGVMFKPTPGLRLEAMGAWVHWSAYDDFRIKISDSSLTDEDAKALVEQERDWARANVDSFWAALDAKGYIGKRWTVGGRYWFDKAAVPDEALSTNNWDGDSHLISAMVAYRPVKPLELGLSYTHHFIATREISNSSFYQTIEGTEAEDRWNYPHANGVYAGSIDRVALQVRGHFGKQPFPGRPDALNKKDE